MDERWQKVEGILEAARERAREERSAFLDEACAGDDSLREEVELLLVHGEQAGSFMEAPAFRAVSELFTGQAPASPVGHVISFYKIISEIGRGGMGEVFLAHDTRLGRLVALKLLPEHFTKDRDRVSRFRLEARAASALNHPNILTIYDIGETGRTHYIATEFVDGMTLREQMTGTPLGLGEVLDVITQVASALKAAHAAGIVHRDIKPENIMTRGDGIVKVLDFGLAKLINQQGYSDNLTLINTEKGTVIGTTPYMSPEQTRGQEVDARTDIWSMGVVLYEMVTGRAPYKGETSSDVIAAILNTEPAPLRHFSPDAPPELERIVARMLCKDKDGRYQNTNELLNDLKSLTQELVFATKLEHAARPDSPGDTQRNGSPPERPRRARGEKPKTRVVSGTGHIMGEIRRRKIGATIMFSALVAALAVVFFIYTVRPGQRMQGITTIAVLPFTNGTGDQAMDYLCDGLSESLIDRLSQLPNLKVVAHTSSFKFKSKDTDLQEVARALGVQAVVVGRVIQWGNNLQVRAELVNADDRTQLWSGQYSRRDADVQVVQADLSREISDQLRPKLTSEEKKRISNSYTDDKEAYDLFLKGRFFWNKLNEDGLKKSIDFFNQAVDRDPKFALAYAWLANSYVALGANYLPPQETYPTAIYFAQKARELDDTLAEAHYVLALTQYLYNWNLTEAEKELSRTLELNPNYAAAYSLSCHLLLARGQTNEAIAQIKRAVDLDRFSLLFNANLSYAYYYARQYDQALDQTRKTLKMEPSASFLYSDMCLVYAHMGVYDKALTSCQEAINLLGDDPATLSYQGITYALWNKPTETERVIETLNQVAKKKYVQPFQMASIYAALGEKNEAFAWLDKAYAARSSYMIKINVDPTFDKLRSDPRYKILLQRIGLQ